MRGFGIGKRQIVASLPHLLRSFQNMKIGTIQALACVGLGTMLGLITATRDFSPSSRADGATGQSVDQPTCCSEGAARNVLLAEAGAVRTTATAKAAPNS